jgi:hypothetical protein
MENLIEVVAQEIVDSEDDATSLREMADSLGLLAGALANTPGIFRLHQRIGLPVQPMFTCLSGEHPRSPTSSPRRPPVQLAWTRAAARSA